MYLVFKDCCLTDCLFTQRKFGVAQLSGSNAAVVSTLISCLLAVENFMGKKTNLQSPNQLAFAVKRKNEHVNSEAYAIADVLKTSIYQIVSAFHDQMLSGTKSSPLEKDWITSSKPLYGTREMLIQKLRLFLVFQAT
ncbi:putative nucleoporin protein Ndc1-Nup [Medicago truncatula]|uniref:Putative nucleoporin protein Ndc1-Nup n=1 Tax=Medicago truncatula TaxID=3880 RepID=A0A396GBM4_MEDTR|nr:putative nucleoporin protein Ndc1-Nup [Medicago truncatula]